MGKSFANFMCKKFFHPASYANIKRVWMAEQRTDAEKTKQDNLRAEYEREQDTYTNRQLMGDIRVKHGLNFMYEPPKGMKTEEKEDGDQEYKFEWQRGAPREGYAKDMDVTDQPFGIAVRNVKCIRCHKWGHVNTDRECPLYDQTKDEEIAGPSTDKDDLMEDMRRDGLALKQNVLGRKVNGQAKNQRFVGSSDDDEDEDVEPEEAFLKSLSMKEKIKLLKKLDKMEKKQKRLDSKSSKKRKDKKNMKRRKPSHSSDDSDNSSDELDQRDRRSEKEGGHNGKSRKGRYSDSSDQESDSEQDRKKKSSSKHHEERRTSKKEPDSDGESRKRARKDDRRNEVRKIKREPRSDSEERRHTKGYRREDNDSHRERKIKIKIERRSQSPDSPSHGRHDRNGKDRQMKERREDEDDRMDRRRKDERSRSPSRRSDDRHGGTSSRNYRDGVKTHKESRRDRDRDGGEKDKEKKKEYREEKDRERHRHGDREDGRRH
ncbi:corepressor interacting with RBPJ 1-like [Strongylocentrotus purpuratus]|uniref:CBF1-interacting co-repressor CIR N-terminal domain-containing protein n=1 Tax=Strongylocentrotus purpuratus TaxID=7668 RepID=A0A7M7PCN6_STRPU|nr:corepressor interacting with RBPJ 1-like [Strongylocentrotus purpuratus]|eukprot:XP_794696.2 PREDICTED: corepressor interacting with RBPJ 1 isoform X1 [Strongylocentrotus purpuratus]